MDEFYNHNLMATSEYQNDEDIIVFKAAVCTSVFSLECGVDYQNRSHKINIRLNVFQYAYTPKHLRKNEVLILLEFAILD